ncbi:response regulator [Teredinibacter turnerae]|uniref:response regulator n=1 Tax=Teredinibacter turnerae TaxID=2426 RepID=UPI00038191AF|nr:response regulator [Teredinibacter turnerae]
MRANRPHILIVDDQEMSRVLLQDIFAEKYDVTCLESGEACIEAVQTNSYDLVLLDAHMPGISGYQVCKQLRENPTTASTSIVFVSGLDTVEERLRGYEAGADEYVTKPLDEDTVVARVESVLAERIAVKNIESQRQEAMHTAFQAMASSAELGLTIRFLQASFQCQNEQELAKQLLEATEQYGVACCIRFAFGGEEHLYNCAPESIEAKVLEKITTKHRILDFGARTIITDKHVTLLIKNMPVESPEDYGRLKDNLTVLVDGAEARCVAFEINAKIAQERQAGIRSLAGFADKKLSEIREIILRQSDLTEDVIDEIKEQIEQAVYRLGLDEDEEKALIASVDQAISGASQIIQHSCALEARFEEFTGELHKLANYE